MTDTYIDDQPNSHHDPTPELSQVVPYSLLQFNYQQRLTDRYCQSALFRHSFKGKPIIILVSVEIINPWHPTREVGRNLGQVISREFQQTASQSILVRFEAALKAANQFVAVSAAQVKTPISAAVAILTGNEVHFSGLGQASVTLIRHDRVSQIAPQQSGEQAFSVVTSGDLSPKDWFAIGSNQFGGLISNIAPGIWAQLDAAAVTEAVRSNAPLLPPISGIILRYTPEEPEFSEIALDALGLRAPSAARDGVTAKLKTSLAKIGQLASRMKLPQSLLALRQKLWQRLALLPYAKPIAMVAGVILTLFIGWALFGRPDPPTASVADNLVNPLEQVMASPDAQLLSSLTERFTTKDYSALADAKRTELITRLARQNSQIVELGVAVASLAQPGVALDQTGADLYLIDTTGQLWRFTGRLEKIVMRQLIAQPVSLVAFSPELVVVTDLVGNIWLVNSKSGEVQSLSLPAGLQAGVKLVQKFEGNLYVYTNSSGIFYRVSNFAGDVTKALAYTKKETLPLGPVVDFAINGQVVAIDAAGKVQDFQRDKLGSVSFTANGVSTSFRLDTTKDGQIITSASRLLGVYSVGSSSPRSYLLNSDSAITDSAISSSAVWLLLGSNLYRLPL